jgi:hypothetical protein
LTFGPTTFVTPEANLLEVMYAPREDEEFALIDGSTPSGSGILNASVLRADADNPGRFELNLSWEARPNAATELIGYTVRYRQTKNADGTAFVGTDGHPDIWRTYVNGRSQDFQGTSANPSLTIKNLAEGEYDFKVAEVELTLTPTETKDGLLYSKHVSLEGGLGNDNLTIAGSDGGRMSGGSGRDTFSINSDLSGLSLVTVSDFSAEDDVLRLFLDEFSESTGIEYSAVDWIDYASDAVFETTSLGGAGDHLSVRIDVSDNSAAVYAAANNLPFLQLYFGDDALSAAQVAAMINVDYL